MFQAVFDALGDGDFALAREQLDRTHFTHIHAHRIGGASEFRVNGGQHALGFLDRILIGHHRWRIVDQLVVRRLFVDGQPHVVDHADHVLDLLAIRHVFGQVIVDLGIGQITALLAEHDQISQAQAPGFRLRRRELLALQLAHQRLFLGGEACFGLGFNVGRRDRDSGFLWRNRPLCGRLLQRLFILLFGAQFCGELFRSQRLRLFLWGLFLLRLFLLRLFLLQLKRWFGLFFLLFFIGLCDDPGGFWRFFSRRGLEGLGGLGFGLWLDCFFSHRLLAQRRL